MATQPFPLLQKIGLKHLRTKLAQMEVEFHYAHEREQEAILQWRREQGISVTRRKSASKARVTRDGYAAGQRAGDSISLERQLSSSSGQLLR